MIRIYLLAVFNVTEKEIERLKNSYPARYNSAMKLKSEKSRKQSLAAGVLVDRVLGNEIKYMESGKPYIAGGPEISISHSGEYAVLAVADSAVGVDIQEYRKISDNLLKRVLNENERKLLCEKADLRAERLWVMKEAVVKMLGTGITDKLSEIPCDMLLTAGECEFREHKIYGRSFEIDGYELGVVALEPAEATELIIL